MNNPNDVLTPSFVGADTNNTPNPVSTEVAVRLPPDLCQAAEQMIKGTKFATLEEFLTFVLQEVTSSRSGQSEEQERKVIEDRLRELGYL